MILTSKDLYYAVIHGANRVIKNKEDLNKINVFPVRDGDTGSNLSSMMENIVREASLNKSIKKTMESVAEKALFGAKGNSGIIFAGYFSGLSDAIDDVETITLKQYAEASRKAVERAYKSIANPVEGTMITLMREWANAISEESIKNMPVGEIFKSAYQKIEEALDKTKDQLEVLKKANVVDSGAKGFTYFIEGALYYIQKGEEIEAEKQINKQEDIFPLVSHGVSANEKFRYCTECIFVSEHIEVNKTKELLCELGDSVVVVSDKNKCRIHVHTNEPSAVFDLLYSKGQVVYQKVDDMEHQKSIVEEQRAQIALITDSIADLPKEYIDYHQIHMLYLDILFDERLYMDKLTIKTSRILDLLDGSKKLATSSQPSPKKIENLFNYLSDYYESAIVVTVSKELSGTYHTFLHTKKNYKNKDFKISVLNSRQNSGAEGLLVKRAAELIEMNESHNEIVDKLREDICNSKILVQIKNLDNMIKSGRLSVKVGKIGSVIGMKPIVTLNKEGKGELESITFSSKGSKKSILKHIKKISKRRKIKDYSIVHVDSVDEARELGKVLEKIIGYKASYIMETSSIVAIGAGRGAVAVSYILEREDVKCI